MGQTHSPSSVLLIVAASSRYSAALHWFRDRACGSFGDLTLTSDAFSFTETDYYTATMGSDLRKQFFAFQTLVDPVDLPQVKKLTNDWEAEYAGFGQHPEPRPLNLDPGYITPAKLVLASTKDHVHRIYLANCIYAEVTLTYRDKAWQPLPWTYPDYRRADYHTFFTSCRQQLHARLRSATGES